MKPVLKIKRRLEGAVLPEYKKVKDSGFDLAVCFDEEDFHYTEVEGEMKKVYHLKNGERRLFDTGLTFEIPEGYEVQIRPRSGMAYKEGITVINAPGTIDESYRGKIMICLVNLSGGDFFLLYDGMRIAQGILAPRVQADIVEVENVDKNTDRGDGGFGHTGY